MTSAADDLRIVLVTHPVEGVEAFARSLVEERVVACVNRLAATSVYRWEGALQEDAEVLLVLKTTADRLPRLEERLRVDHPYDVPELVVLAAEAASAGYLAWVRDEVRPAGADG